MYCAPSRTSDGDSECYTLIPVCVYTYIGTQLIFRWYKFFWSYESRAAILTAREKGHTRVSKVRPSALNQGEVPRPAKMVARDHRGPAFLPYILWDSVLYISFGIQHIVGTFLPTGALPQTSLQTYRSCTACMQRPRGEPALSAALVIRKWQYIILAA